jgi:two-component system, chemotaxis family, response regulator Rcp1
MKHDSGAPVDILLVEDNPADIRLAVEILNSAEIANRLSVVSDGVEAMEFLRRHGRFAKAPRPGLILLDLNLPRKDGREVLAEIKQDADLKRIPVIVLSTSSAEADILKSYDLHANSYVSKPLELERFVSVLKSLENFWLDAAELPKR